MTRYVDLTLPIVTGHWRYPNVVRPFQRIGDGVDSNVTYYEMRSHWFTHIDAPRHVDPAGKTLNEYGLDRFIGAAHVLDISGVGPNEPIGADILEKAMARHSGESRLLLKTCWARQRAWTSEAFWDEAPYVTGEGAEYLLAQKPLLVGFDFPQDYQIRNKVKTGRFLETHEILLKNDVLLLEYLHNLWEVPVPRIDLYALPTNLQEADGAQIRVVAAF